MGQSVIGALRVNLGLDSAKFESGARRVQKPLAVMKKQFLAVAGTVAALGTALSVLALKGAKEIDETAKSARRLDASIGGFRALELAAGEAGVSLSGLTNDIQTMNREISTIGTSGNGKRALDALGLSVDDLAGKDADEKLAIIADQVKALGFDAGKTTAILRDLGVRNREMALLVLGGGDAIRSARSDIEEYGLAISDVDAGRIEVANDAIGRLALIGQYAGQKLAVALVPAMGAFAVVMTDSLRAGGLLRNMIDGLVGNLDVLAYSSGVAVTAFGVRYVGAFALAKMSTFSLVGALAVLKAALIATGIGALIVGAGYLISKFVDLVAATGSWGAALSALGDLAAGVWSGIKISAQSIPASLSAVWSMVQSSFFGMLSHIQEAWSRFLGNLGQDLADIPGLGAFADKILQTAGMAAGASAEFDAKAQGAAGSAARLNSEASALADKGFEAARSAAQRLSEIVNSTNDSLSDSAVALPSVASGLDDVAASGGGASGSLGGVKASVKALKDSASDMKDTFKGAFKDLVTGAKSFGEVVGNVLNKIADKLLDSAFDSLWGGGGSGSGVSGSIFGGGGSLLSKLIPGFANGTNNAPGGLATINERGGELVNLPNGSQVIPHDLSKRMMGGGQQNVHVTVGIDADSSGNLMPFVSGVVKSATPSIQSGATQQTIQYMSETTDGWG